MRKSQTFGCCMSLHLKIFWYELPWKVEWVLIFNLFWKIYQDTSLKTNMTKKIHNLKWHFSFYGCRLFLRVLSTSSTLSWPPAGYWSLRPVIANDLIYDHVADFLLSISCRRTNLGEVFYHNTSDVTPNKTGNKTKPKPTPQIYNKKLWHTDWF